MSGALLNVSGVAGAILYNMCDNRDDVKNPLYVEINLFALAQKPGYNYVLVY